MIRTDTEGPDVVVKKAGHVGLGLKQGGEGGGKKCRRCPSRTLASGCPYTTRSWMMETVVIQRRIGLEPDTVEHIWWNEFGAADEELWVPTAASAGI